MRCGEARQGNETEALGWSEDGLLKANMLLQARWTMSPPAEQQQVPMFLRILCPAKLYVDHGLSQNPQA